MPAASTSTSQNASLALPESRKAIELALQGSGSNRIEPMTTTTQDKQELLSLYRGMVLIRRCEEQLARSHQKGLIHGACHTYVGQEAIAVGVAAHLRRDDVVFSTHRGHGHALAKGAGPGELIAELF